MDVPIRKQYPSHCVRFSARKPDRDKYRMIDDRRLCPTIECVRWFLHGRSVRGEGQTTNKGTIDRSMGVNVKGRKSKKYYSRISRDKKEKVSQES